MSTQADLFESINEPPLPTAALIDETPPSTVREVIERYIQSRLQDKLEKLKPEQADERAKLLESYLADTWLDNASLRVGRLSLATHTPKQNHPKSKASAVYVNYKSASNKIHSLVASSVTELNLDVIGDAAALDIFKMLRLEFKEETLLSRLLRQDEAFKLALAADTEIAAIRFERFLAFAQIPSQLNAGRTAKQLYFPVDATTYHILILLYPSSLVHCAWQQMQTDRFGETQKSLRELRRSHQYAEQEVRDYPNLLIQSYGGTKPQNISQLNSDRGGKMTLLPSLPPVWRGQDFKVPKQDTIFSWYLRNRAAIQSLLDELGKLYRNPNRVNNIDFHLKRDEMLDDLINEIIVTAFELQQNAPSAWTQQQKFDPSEAYWLDIGYRNTLFIKESQGDINEDEQEWLQQYRSRDWHKNVGLRFGNWLNANLKLQTKKSNDLATLDDSEAQVWSNRLRNELNLLSDEEA